MAAAATRMMADLNSTPTSQVRVGVRIRPLTPKESSEGGKVVLNVNAFDRTVTLSNRKFTYDSVFHSNVTQLDLYSSVAPPLLDSFLNGFNATILAYGQTGSGKTYTMGSEAGTIDETNFLNGNVSDNIGLIPRFISDIFESLFRRREASEKASLRKTASHQSVSLVDFRVSASFLEVYGEDIFDLLDENRNALKIREDSNKEVVIVGLKQVHIHNSVDARNILNTGTMNRTTAATLMNFTSSRSHACFTVNLQQTTRSADGDDVTTTSRFTFVDLAGSERMKKTGAEGARAKEGIKINEGLLALGNVINALADEERLAKGERVHVPYRQSKLTRLLQDALGGNSQTLFLACVSPSDTNASETLSTLHYANRARNIKNAPTRNIDATAEELRRLRALTSLLKCELIKQRFDCKSSVVTTNPERESTDQQQNFGVVDEDLMLRDDVIAYMNQIEEKASELGIGYSSDRKLPQSVLDAPQLLRLTSAETSSNDKIENEEDEASYVSDVGENPESGMQMNDNAIADHPQDDQIRKIEGDIEEQEERLLQLKERIRQQHDMQEKYIILTNEVQKLEIEKQDLAEKLEKAQGEGATWIKTKLEHVQSLLAQARQDIRKQQQKCREAEMDAQRCKGLENRIDELKSAKANLLKKQKEEAKKQRDYSKTKARELQDATRRERSAQKTVLKLEAENQRLKAVVERSKARNIKLSNKLKDTESSLKQALSTRRNNSVQSPNEDAESDVLAPTSRTIDSIKYLLDKSVIDRVALSQTRSVLKSKFALQQSLLQSIAVEANILSELERHEDAMSSEPSNDETLAEVKYHKDNVQDLSIQLELLENSIDELRAKLPCLKDESNGNAAMDNVFNECDSVMKVISKLHFRDLRTLVLSFLSSSYSSELDRQQLKSALAAKDLRLATLEDEIVTKNEKINILTISLGRSRESEEMSTKIKDFVGEQSNGSPTLTRQATNGTNGLTNDASSLSKDFSSSVGLSSPAAITPSSTRASKFGSLKQRYLKKVQSPKPAEEEITTIPRYNLRKTNNRG